ncbi:PH domain-containing protein [Halocatena pleomorpha]|uniref:PH domain-containing protein n=1 Tax=Halocatena pleomorpha TaxID=1785090 RepID=A0A3P3R5I0_9EURY|nr:PH domain-containing protein [Halocatena pleomorpha]RRJ28149.1 PH domain-containing protein [Halocatena pleomorpha]
MSETKLPDTHDASTEGVPLLEEELVLENIHPHWVNWLKLIGIGAFFALFGVLGVLTGDIGMSIPFIGVAALVGGYVYLDRKNTRYVVTTERVYKKSGILRRTTNEARMSDIHSLSTDESWAEWVFGKGTVQIDSTGATGILSLPGTTSHEQVEDMIRTQQQEITE